MAIRRGVGQRDDRLPFLTERLLDAFELTAIRPLRSGNRAGDEDHRGGAAREARSCVHA